MQITRLLSTKYKDTGKDFLKLQLINQRWDFSLALFSGGLLNDTTRDGKMKDRKMERWKEKWKMEAGLTWPLSFCRPDPLVVRGNRISICLLGLEFVYLFLKNQSYNLLEPFL